MSVHVALDPSLKLSAAEFVHAWNRSANAAQAPAKTVAATRGTFFDPALTVALVTVVATIPASVVANFVSDYLKQKYLDDAPKVTVTIITAPDGEPLMVVKQEEIL